jgi:hypothetical protein
MNVLFLDVDGVLNNTSCKDRLSTENLLNLQEIVSKTQCVIVISSTYKLTQSSMNYLWSVFNDLKIDRAIHSIKEFPSTYDLLELIKDSDRSDEIVLTLDDIKLHYNVSNWVAVDDTDLSNNNRSNTLDGHFVKTDPKEGLTKSISSKIIDLFTSSIIN